MPGAVAAHSACLLPPRACSSLLQVSVSINSEGVAAAGFRNFTSLDAIAAEVGLSRVLGGIHVRREGADGLTLGRDAANFVFNRIR